MFSKLFVVLVGFAACAFANYDEDSAARPRYHVDLLRLNNDDVLTHVCDGVILSSRYLLTAAHCIVNEMPAKLRVRSGSDVAPPENLPHLEERLFHRVIKVMYPKDYVPTPCRLHEHDIAILKVSRNFDLSYDRLYKQVSLPEPTNDFEDYNAVISAYLTDKVENLGAKVISNEECAKNATSIITKGNLCAIVSDEAVASDVSGSPLVYDNTLIGIQNAPNKCSSDSKVVIPCVEQAANLKVYTRVTAYLEFIDKVLNQQPSSDIVYLS